MIQTGTTAFGAVSSYATEMDACINTPAKVVFFNELIGSNAAMADVLWGDFLSRLKDSKQFKSDTFFPAVAIHSPYSVHPILVQKAISVAKNDNLPLTAHLLESDAEREWLTSNSGEFAPFFKDFLQQERAVTDITEFISAFNNKETLFTHATKLSQEEAQLLNHNRGHAIIHCPISNRLLGNGVLDLKNLYEHNIDYVCGTDGLSSNYSLDLLEELKAALYMHDDANLDTLALSLLHSTTTLAGKHLGLNSGKIEKGFDADFLTFDLENELCHDEDLALHIILKNHPLQSVFISGPKEHHAKS
jgi:cytosine/adenosine deaminase-related metal-dependent hydrolase